jgi:hypothetical protein
MHANFMPEMHQFGPKLGKLPQGWAILPKRAESFFKKTSMFLIKKQILFLKKTSVVWDKAQAGGCPKQAKSAQTQKKQIHLLNRSMAA